MARNCRDNPDAVTRPSKKDDSDDSARMSSSSDPSKALPAKILSTTSDTHIGNENALPPSSPILRLDLKHMVIEEVQCYGEGNDRHGGGDFRYRTFFSEVIISSC